MSALAEAYEERRVCAPEELPKLAPEPQAAPLDIDPGLEIVLELEDDTDGDEPNEEAEGIPVLELDGDGVSGFELEDDTPPAPAPEAAAEDEAEDDACRPASDEAITEEQAKALLLAKLLGRTLEPGHPGEELAPEDVVNLAGEAVSRLVRQIERTFDHHINTLGGDAIQKIFFSGDICTNAYFLDVLTRQLHIPCSLLDPLGVLGAGPMRRAYPTPRPSVWPTTSSAGWPCARPGTRPTCSRPTRSRTRPTRSVARATSSTQYSWRWSW